MITPTASTLSGGTRQRIGLARAFYGNPKVLILDEPNANLEAEGEAALEKALMQARTSGTTIIIITHR
ncbi:ATP-binding cassette domain-containing protein (plasmid) [Rhizobium leguminosarum bv. viciae]|uniref:ATP-binding cassette domain-containing protein n=1 Tax=Rhizobium leguminosarum bv. viciae TaxID=387 RepID=A0A7G6RNW2_RHILV|nr:ATP-binding cassette domain-containing protein [Rhizobium leguminosarum bv. viciae]